MNLQSLPKGVYMIRAEEKDMRSIGKLVKL
jgi:hypothetical protein